MPVPSICPGSQSVSNAIVAYNRCERQRQTTHRNGFQSANASIILHSYTRKYFRHPETWSAFSFSFVWRESGAAPERVLRIAVLPNRSLLPILLIYALVVCFVFRQRKNKNDSANENRNTLKQYDEKYIQYYLFKINQSSLQAKGKINKSTTEKKNALLVFSSIPESFKTVHAEQNLQVFWLVQLSNAFPSFH